ncbi:MAG: methyl-accepting chemotaxis protein [Limnothrix sp.]
MTVTTDTLNNNQLGFSAAVKELQAAIAVDPTDAIAKITLASQLEQEGFLEEAAKVYQDIIDTDEDGVFAASAEQALLSINIEPAKPSVEQPSQTTATRTVPTPAPTKTYSPAIEELRQEVAASPTDMVAQISLASAFENAGHSQEAAQTYQYIIDHDTDGVFSSSAAKALESLQDQPVSVAVEMLEPEPAPLGRQAKSGKRVKLKADDYDEDAGDISPILSNVRNLPIAQKQFVGFLLSSVISLTGVVGAGIAITGISGRSQLKSQAAAELAVNQIQYNIKINQMGFGFRGQSDNAAVVEAGSLNTNNQPIPPALQAQVEAILKNEIQARTIEYATLVGTDLRILASANADRRGEVFDPNGLVSKVLANPEQIKASEIVSWAELQAENPPLPAGTPEGQDALVRYTVTPVDGANGEIVGVLVSGDVVVKDKVAIAQSTVESFESGYSSVYQVNPDGSFTLAAAATQAASGDTSLKTSANAQDQLQLEDDSLLTQALAADGEIVTDTQAVNGVQYTFAAQALKTVDGQPVAVLVRGSTEDGLNALLRNSLLLQAGVGLLAVLLSAVLAGLLGRAISKPIQELQETAEQFGEGDLNARATATSQDEVGRLAETFNVMADQITLSTEAIAAQSKRNEDEATFQKQERERLQEAVIRLLLQIEEARRGDLRVQAEVDAGEVGSIADAFNATLRSLRLLVSQVQTSANQVHDSAIANTGLITKLSDEATQQEQAIQSAEKSVQGIARSIQSVAKSAQVAAKIAKKSRLAAQQGQKTMDETVENIDTIRSSVADTSKKAKRLAESSQEISKIVSIISDISEKTNLLAFNASIEATRAGENGQGFRVVADEVRRLAEQVTTSAQEIEQLIGGIQEETVQMMQMMEESTSQVVTGTELVRKTKTTLQNVARISEEIDKVLGSISKATVSQRDASSKVTKTMQSVAVVAQQTAAESKMMSSQLKSLSEVAIALQQSSSRFKVD